MGINRISGKQTPNLSGSKRNRSMDNLERDTDLLQSPTFQGEICHDSTQKRRGKNTWISTEFKPLFQCSVWTSKASKQEFLSVLIWLPSGIGNNSDAAKYGLRVVDEGNCLEVSILWPKHVSDITVLMKSAACAGCKLEDSEITGFEAATATVQSSNVQSIESKGFIPLPYTVTPNTKERYNLNVGEFGTLVVLLRLVLHKEQEVVHYDDGNFLPGHPEILHSPNAESRTDLGQIDPASTPDPKEKSLS